MLKACVADIERAAAHDGPGIRTTVFLKGCPLHCMWCHNPECISFEKELLYYPEKCIGCGKCEEGCFSGAKVLCGKNMTVQEVLSEILLDQDYYGTEGGVTFSGGEPLAQKEFLYQIIPCCKEHKIGCAIETSLIYYDAEILKNMDVIMADLKIWNSDLHRKYTGVGNEKIKEHFKRVNELEVPIIARTPVIPEINQEIGRISEFLKSLENVKQYELLPYHPLGRAKRQALGKAPDDFSIPSADYMKELEKYVFIR